MSIPGGVKVTPQATSHCRAPTDVNCGVTTEADGGATILGADRSCGVHQRTAEVNGVHFMWDGSRRSPSGPNTASCGDQRSKDQRNLNQ